MPRSAPRAIYCKSDIKSDLLKAPSLPSGSGDGKSYSGAGAALGDAEAADVFNNY